MSAATYSPLWTQKERASHDVGRDFETNLRTERRTVIKSRNELPSGKNLIPPPASFSSASLIRKGSPSGGRDPRKAASKSRKSKGKLRSPRKSLDEIPLETLDEKVIVKLLLDIDVNHTDLYGNLSVQKTSGTPRSGFRGSPTNGGRSPESAMTSHANGGTIVNASSPKRKSPAKYRKSDEVEHAVRMRRQYRHPKTLEEDLLVAEKELRLVSSERDQLQDGLDDALTDLETCRGALENANVKVQVLGRAVKSLLHVVSEQGRMKPAHIALLETLIDEESGEVSTATQELQRLAELVSRPVADEELVQRITSPASKADAVLRDAEEPLREIFERLEKSEGEFFAEATQLEAAMQESASCVQLLKFCGGELPSPNDLMRNSDDESIIGWATFWEGLVAATKEKVVSSENDDVQHLEGDSAKEEDEEEEEEEEDDGDGDDDLPPPPSVDDA